MTIHVFGIATENVYIDPEVFGIEKTFQEYVNACLSALCFLLLLSLICYSLQHEILILTFLLNCRLYPKLGIP